jgi:peptidyl-prolyl cis-trans isomerase B (cyclophilin B)
MTKALMETEAGPIELELFEADAPNTVANFVKLAKDGFYDGLAFHSVIPWIHGPGRMP